MSHINTELNISLLIVYREESGRYSVHVGRLKTKEGPQNSTIQGVVVKKELLNHAVTSLASHQDGHTQLQGT